MSSLDAVNSLLPPGFLVEPQTSVDCHRRKGELELLQLDPRFCSPPQPRSVHPPALAVAGASRLPVAEGFRRLYLILSKLKKHPESAAFQTGEEPNLASIESRLLREEYMDAREFAEDLRLVFAKADSHTTISAYFETIMTGHEDILLTLRKKPKLVKTVQPLTVEEKRILTEKIRQLDAKYLKGIEEVAQVTLKGKDLILDLDNLQPSAARGLREYVEMCLQKARQTPKQTLAAPPEIQQVAEEASPPSEQEIQAFLPPINAPVRLGLAGFHQILPKVLR